MGFESMYESGEYLANNSDWHAIDAPFKAKWISDILRRNSVEPTTMVEVGCGSGEILVSLASKYPSATFEGYDISPQAYSIAAPKSSPRVRFIKEDYLKLDTPVADVVMAIDVLEHVDDYISFIQALKGRAEYAVFHIPLDLSVQTILRGTPIMRVREKVGHLHYFYKDSALATLEYAGFEIVDWNYTHQSEELLNRPVRERVLNLPRKLLRLIDEDFAVRTLGGSSLMVLAR